MTENFFIFVSKVDIQHFALYDSTLIITITIMITCHPCYHATHPPMLACHPHKHSTHPTHATHTSTSFTLPTPTILARYPRKHATHAIYASMSSGPFLKLVRKFSPLKNCHFWKFWPKNHYHEETFISLCYMLFKTCIMYMDVIMNITVYNSAYIWLYLLNAKL